MGVNGIFSGTLHQIIHALPGLDDFELRMTINDAGILITSPTASLWADPLELCLVLSGSALAINETRDHHQQRPTDYFDSKFSIHTSYGDLRGPSPYAKC